MDRVLVTGGAGYIGRHVCAALAAQGFVPVVLDDLSTGERASVVHGPFIDGDVRDVQALGITQNAHRPIGVIHLAAHSDVAESVRDPDKYRENIEMTAVLAGTLATLPAVLASSAAVYGEGGDQPVGEDRALSPLSPYGCSKAACEALMPGAMRLRFFNVAGGAGGKAQHLIPALLRSAEPGAEPFSLYGTGCCVRDFVAVEDVAAAVVSALVHRLMGRPPATLNICTGRGRMVGEVMNACRKIAPMQPFVELFDSRAGDPDMLIGDPALAWATLGWKATQDLDAMVRSAWEAMRGPR